MLSISRLKGAMTAAAVIALSGVASAQDKPVAAMTAREVVIMCRDELAPRRMRSAELKVAVLACLEQRRPDIARGVACRNEARAQNINERLALATFMRTCRER